MKNPFEQVFSKEEKAELLAALGQISSKLTLLQNGSREDLNNSFSGLVKLIESFLTPEEKDILNIENKINEGLAVVQQSSEFIQQSKTEVEKDKELINNRAMELERLLYETTSKAKAIDDHLSQTTESLGIITSKKNELAGIVGEIEELTAKSEIASAKLQAFEEAIESVEDSKTKISLTQKNARELLLQVKALHTEVFGGEDKNEETGETEQVEGLVAKLEKSYAGIEDELSELHHRFEKLQKDKQGEYESINLKWENEFSSLKAKIESLLPGALSAGLSQAYEEKKNFEIKEIEKSSETFYKAIKGLVAISGAPVLLYLYLLAFSEKTLEQIFELSPNVFLAMLPVYLPCLWVAYSSDKKAKLSKRLAEEYAHKSSLSKTFEGISKQVSNIPDNSMSATLESKLLYNLIQVSAENPGKLISDYDKSDHPLYEALDKGIAFSEALDKISIIPGIDKLMARVQRKNQERLKKLSDSLDDEEESREEGVVVAQGTP